MAKLVIYEDFEQEELIIEDFELSTPRILIGSGLDNELVLESPTVDSTHASLELRDEDWFLQDLGGPQETIVNQAILDGPYQLQHNDIIQLGGVKLRFLADTAQEEAAVAEVELLDRPDAAAEPGTDVSGRAWFAAIAGITLAIIFLVIFLLVLGHYLGLLDLAALLPWLAPTGP